MQLEAKADSACERTDAKYADTIEQSSAQENEAIAGAAKA